MVATAEELLRPLRAESCCASCSAAAAAAAAAAAEGVLAAALSLLLSLFHRLFHHEFFFFFPSCAEVSCGEGGGAPEVGDSMDGRGEVELECARC